MNEKKKGFNLFPEYVWMIFVGMLLAILILTNVFPGHAAEVTPVPGLVTNYNNYGIYITVQRSNIYVNGQFLLDYASVVESDDPEASQDLFFHDATAALTQLFSFIPANQTSIVIANDAAYNSAINMLTEVLAQFDCHVNNPIDDLEFYDYQYYPLGQFTIRVLVRNNLIAPTLTPTPAPELSREYVIIKSSSYYYAIFFDYNLYVATQPLVISGNQNIALSYAVNNYGVGYDFSYPTIIFQSGSSSYSDRLLSLYIPSATSCNFTLYSLGESLPLFDYSEIPSHFDPYSLTSSSNIPSKNGAWYYSFNSSLGLNAIGCYKYSNGLSFIDSSLYTYVVGYESSFFTSDFFNTGYNVADNLLTLAYKYGCSSDPTYNPNITPTPGPTATPVPLPTSGESIHVILPSGTPTPTPPFSVPGGSNGGTGSGSPGSIGSGLSSQQTSGILEYWSSFVADNPAMLFLTSTFQSLPSELLYPLYILLFILLLLAVIRLFVHFSGG